MASLGVGLWARSAIAVLACPHMEGIVWVTRASASLADLFAALALSVLLPYMFFPRSGASLLCIFVGHKARLPGFFVTICVHMYAIFCYAHALFPH